MNKQINCDDGKSLYMYGVGVWLGCMIAIALAFYEHSRSQQSCFYCLLFGLQCLIYLLVLRHHLQTPIFRLENNRVYLIQGLFKQPLSIPLNQLASVNKFVLSHKLIALELNLTTQITLNYSLNRYNKKHLEMIYSELSQLLNSDDSR